MKLESVGFKGFYFFQAFEDGEKTTACLQGKYTSGYKPVLLQAPHEGRSVAK
jgi:hypothetical protein